MTHILYTGEEEIYRPAIVRTIYDPACSTGGMLSVSEEYIREHNPQANLELFGQDYNDESWAICCSDLLIKDEPVDYIVKGGLSDPASPEAGIPRTRQNRRRLAYKPEHAVDLAHHRRDPCCARSPWRCRRCDAALGRGAEPPSSGAFSPKGGYPLGRNSEEIAAGRMSAAA